MPIGADGKYGANPQMVRARDKHMSGASVEGGAGSHGVAHSFHSHHVGGGKFHTTAHHEDGHVEHRDHNDHAGAAAHHAEVQGGGESPAEDMQYAKQGSAEGSQNDVDGY